MKHRQKLIMENLYIHIAKNNLKVTDVEKELGKHQSQLSAWKSGKNILTESNARHICLYLESFEKDKIIGDYKLLLLDNNIDF